MVMRWVMAHCSMGRHTMRQALKSYKPSARRAARNYQVTTDTRVTK